MVGKPTIYLGIKTNGQETERKKARNRLSNKRNEGTSSSDVNLTLLGVKTRTAHQKAEKQRRCALIKKQLYAARIDGGI